MQYASPARNIAVSIPDVRSGEGYEAGADRKSSGELFLTLPTSFETSKASISSAGKGRSRSIGGRAGSESRSSQRSKSSGRRMTGAGLFDGC